MNTTINSGVSFQAKLDISGIKRNQSRWEKIAKEFEAKTKEYPHDMFNISDSSIPGYCLFFARTKNGKVLGQEDISCIRKPLADILDKLDDSELVVKLKKLFNIQRRKDNLNKEARAFYTKYIDKSKINGDEQEKFREAWFAAEDALVDRTLKTDKLLYANREYIEMR